jgi:hypothetical protein
MDAAELPNTSIRSITLHSNKKETKEKPESGDFSVTGDKRSSKGCKSSKPRVVTHEKRWVLEDADYSPDAQFKCLFYGEGDERICKLAKQQILTKIAGYRTQDIKNQILDKTKFIETENILQLLHDCKMRCFYCKEMVQVLYKNVREPKQWTLDRIDNLYGHNTDNVMIACLNCNLRRRCMYHERYLFTKQLNVVKKDGCS